MLKVSLAIHPPRSEYRGSWRAITTLRPSYGNAISDDNGKARLEQELVARNSVNTLTLMSVNATA